MFGCTRPRIPSATWPKNPTEPPGCFGERNMDSIEPVSDGYTVNTSISNGILIP